ncbi:MAG: nitrile hydratase subunit alpha [Alphaproteobacteria bacterium]|nr:nitrile hydratase subunit alpha [Alphaproteobacteria bacterium]
MTDPHTHGQDHHDHGHPHTPVEEKGDGEYALMAEAMRQLLVEKGVITADEFREQIERMDARSPALGARMVARAWVDPAYKARLLKDGSAAAEELLDITVAPLRLIVVENKPGLHNMIVCTLCSCYPRNVLGLPPDWYKSRPYRSRAVSEPRAVLAEFGTVLGDDVEVRVHDSTADMRYLVLPMRPAGTEGWSEEKLAAIVTRDTMIGVTQPRANA